MMTRKLHILLISAILAIKAFGQMDTVTFQHHDVKKKCAANGQKCKYWVDNKSATEASYNQAVAEMDKIANCKPCYFRSIDKKGKLIFEGDFYTDCCIGTYIERYEDGKLKTKGEYKTPATKIPDYNKGDCRRHGEWIYYRPNGEIDEKKAYRDGVITKELYRD